MRVAPPDASRTPAPNGPCPWPCPCPVPGQSLSERGPWLGGGRLSGRGAVGHQNAPDADEANRASHATLGPQPGLAPRARGRRRTVASATVKAGSQFAPHPPWSSPLAPNDLDPPLLSADFLFARGSNLFLPTGSFRDQGTKDTTHYWTVGTLFQRRPVDLAQTVCASFADKMHSQIV